jgi:hypothetical protein
MLRAVSICLAEQNLTKSHQTALQKPSCLKEKIKKQHASNVRKPHTKPQSYITEKTSNSTVFLVLLK